MVDLQVLTTLSTNDISELEHGKKVVLLSPRLKTRNVLLLEVAADPNVYFYALTPQDSTLQLFLTSLIKGLQDFDNNFGTNTLAALNQKKSKISDWADALASDLKKSKPQPSALVLDSFDYLTIDGDTVAFFQHFVDALPENTKLYINSRTLSFEPWGEMVRDGRAIVLGESAALNGGIFRQDAPAVPQLEVYSFSTGRVFVNGIPVTTWDGPLPRNLFFYFIDHPLVTRDEIFETFWPELNTKDATNVFHVTKRKISERIGFELTAYSGGFYRPSDQTQLHYDVANFEQTYTVADNATTDENIIGSWYQTIKLYRNEFLHSLNMPWIVDRRETLKQKYVNALVNVARIYKSMDEDDRAVHFYSRAIREVPQREDIHRDLMSIYASNGQHDKAIAQYHLLRDILWRSFKIKPSKATRGLFTSISGQAEE